MKKVRALKLAGAWLGLMVLVSPGFAFALESAPGPQIVFEREEIDFGQVPAGQTVTCAFRFRNTGRQALQVLNVSPACGCTTAGDWDHTVAPGAQGSLALRLDTHNMRGHIRKRVSVTTNDTARPSVQLFLAGEVAGGLTAEPAQINFGRLYPENQPFVRTVRVSNHDPQPLLGSAAASNSPAFTAAWRELQTGREFELKVGVAAGLRPGEYAGFIRIDGGRPPAASLIVPVSAVMPDLVDVQPQKLLLPAATLSEPYTRSLVIRYSGSGRLRLTAIAADAPGIKTALETVVPYRLFLANISLPAGWTLPAAGANLRIKTKDPNPSEITVPVVSPNREP
jgi:hypothetical protein